jgi:hypothetical protein
MAQTGYVINSVVDTPSSLLVGKTLNNEWASGTSVGKQGSLDIALAHFTNEAQINSMNGQIGKGTGWIVEGTLIQTTTAGQLVSIIDFSPYSGCKWKVSDNTDAITSTNQLGICLIGGAADDPTQILIKGFYCTSEATYYDNPSTLGAGVPLYIGTTGSVTSDAPTASGSYVRIIGDVWRSEQGANAGTTTIIYFNPQNVFSYIET